MSDLFSFDRSDLLDVGTASGLLWSPEGKVLPKQSVDPMIDLGVSPPSSKETFQKLRTKYQSALSTMNSNTQLKSIKQRRRQSFAISQMLQSVTTIASTPLKMSTADTEKMVESMRKSTVKRRSVAPKSNRKAARARALRRVSRSIDEIFESHFAETANLGSLIAPTPHLNRTQAQSSKEVMLVDRFDDDPVLSVDDVEPYVMPAPSTPRRTAEPTPAASTARAPAPSTPRSSYKQATPLSLAVPASPRTSAPGAKSGIASYRKNTLSSAAAVSALGTPKTAPGTPRSSAKSTVPSSIGGASTMVTTPTRSTTGAGRTPYFTAPGTQQRVAGTPQLSGYTPRRVVPTSVLASASKHLSSVAATASMSVRGAIGGYTVRQQPSTPQSIARQRPATATTPKSQPDVSVQLSSEKMGALLQSMKRHDASRGNNRIAALTVTKTRACTPGSAATTASISSAVASSKKKAYVPTSVAKTLPFTDADCDVGLATDSGVESEVANADGDFLCDLTYDGNCEEDSRIMDAVLSLDLDMAAFADMDDLGDSGSEGEGEAEGEKSVMGLEAGAEAETDAVELSMMDVEDGEAVECSVEAGAVEQADPDVDDEVVDGETEESAMVMRTDCCAPTSEASANRVEEGDSESVIPDESVTVLRIHTDFDEQEQQGPEDIELAEDPALAGYASDSSTSPQIVRVRYSVGSTARRSLSNTRGRLSLGALDGVGLAGDRADTSPLVFHAPVSAASRAGSRRPSLGSCIGTIAAAVNAEMENPIVRAPSPQRLPGPATSSPLPVVRSPMSAAAATPRSMAKGPLRVIRSSVKSLSTEGLLATLATTATPKAAPTADSDGEESSPLPSASKDRIRSATQAPRRKSLGNVSVTSLIRRFQTQAQALALQQALSPSAEVLSPTAMSATLEAVRSPLLCALATLSSNPPTVMGESEFEPSTVAAALPSTEKPALSPAPATEASPRVARSTSKNARSAQKSSSTPAPVAAEEGVLSSRKSTSKVDTPKIVAAEEEGTDVCASLRKAALEILNTVGSETPMTPLSTKVKAAKSTGKKSRQSTAKKAQLDVVTAVDDGAAEGGAGGAEVAIEDANDENLAATVLNTLPSAPTVPLQSAMKTTSKRRRASLAAVTIASPAPVMDAEATDPPVTQPAQRYALRSSRKSMLAAVPGTPCAPETTGQDCGVAQSSDADPSRELFGIKSGALRTPATKTKSKRATLGASKTPAGTYTAMKVKRLERNQKLEQLGGMCDELLSMIDATIQS